jgi:hypothetical protein
MSLKIHSLHWYLDLFPKNCDALSDEHEEHFLQDLSSMEKRYQGKWNCAMLTDYCWALAVGCPYHGIQATGKTKKKNVILFVLNDELT